MSDSNLRSDSSLLQEWVGRGNESCFRQLVERYAGLVQNVALRALGDHALAHDAAQGTFILLARHAEALSAYPTIGGWLHVAVTNQCKNLRRSQMRESRKQAELAKQMPPAPPAPPSECMGQELDRAMAGLTAAEREVLLLRYYRALSIREVASAMGISVEATKKRLTRSTERLKARLVGRGFAMSIPMVTSLLVGMSNEARASSQLVSSLCQQALLHAAPASKLISFPTVIFIMNKKAIIAASAFVLIFGGALVLVKVPSAAEGKPDSRNGGSSHGEGSAQSRKEAEGVDTKTKSGLRPSREKPAAILQLEERFGEARVRLAGRVSGDYLRILQGRAALAELDGAYEPGMNISEAELGPLLNRLNLSEDQKTEMEKIFQGNAYDNMMKLKAFADKLGQSGPALTEALLLADAHARGDIDTGSFENGTGKIRQIMDETNVGTTQVRGFFSGKFSDLSLPRNQPAVQEKMRSILSPDQVEALDAYVDENGVDLAAPRTASLANILPAGKLEELAPRMSAEASMMDKAEALFGEMRKMEKAMKNEEN